MGLERCTLLSPIVEKKDKAKGNGRTDEFASWTWLMRQTWYN